MKAKFVLEVHDLWPEYMYDVLARNGFERRIARLWRWTERRFAKAATAIFVLWPGMPEYYGSIGLDDKKIVFLPLGIDREKYLKNRTQRLARMSSAEPSAPFRIVVAARLGPASNIEDFLEIFFSTIPRINRQVAVEIYGDGTKRRFLEDLVRERSCSRYVNFHGMVSRLEISDALKNADLAVATLPDVDHYNLYGPIPTKVIDYIQNCIPILFISSLDKKVNILSSNEIWLSCDPNHKADGSKILESYILNQNYETVKQNILNQDEVLSRDLFKETITRKLKYALESLS